MVKPNINKRLVLLDAHAILHRAYHALPDFSTSKGEPTGALYGLSAMLIGIIEHLKPDYIVACYDVKGPTYRHEVFKGYKAQRKKADDELIAQMITSRKIFGAMDIPIYDKEGYEADDILGTIVEQLIKDQEAKKEKTEIVIASGDMDTMQLVVGDRVQVYTLKKGIKDTIMYDEKAVVARFGFGPELIPDYKGLRGDPSDNIPGVKGVGEKTATSLISHFGSLENIYSALKSGRDEEFKKIGITPRIIQVLKDNEEEAEFSKMLATINRQVPIKFDLPEKTFKESLDIEKASAIFKEYEFKTLTQRLEKAIGNDVGSDKNDDPVKDQSSDTDQPTDFQQTAVALWLVDSNLTNPTLEDMLNFANKETYEEAKEVIFRELANRNVKKVYTDIELPLIPIIDKMEKRGIKVDDGFLNDLSRKYHIEVNRLEKEIWKHAGVEFNINSPKQLGEILFDKLNLTTKNLKKTAGGARSTRESELEKLRDQHPIISFIFEYRELMKLLSTYIDAIPPLLDENKRLHSHLVSAGTTTGRMASINPNLQNIPIRSDLGRPIRKAFVAEKGFKLCSFDYSQMELRIAAFLSGDEKLIEIFREGKDVHTSVASFVFGVPEDQVTSEMRHRAKAINFGMIYGMGVVSLQKSIGTTRAEAQKFFDDYFKTFSVLANYLDQIKSETARKGYTKTFFGRRRYFEGINSKIPFIRASAERMAINAPIQGTEADIIKIAMIDIDAYVTENKLDKGVFALLQVHDELVYEIREDLAEKTSIDIVNIMESIMSEQDTKGVILKAEVSIGNSWGDDE